MANTNNSPYYPAEGQSFRSYIDELLSAKPKFTGLFTQESPVAPVSTPGVSGTQVSAQMPRTGSTVSYEGSTAPAPGANMTNEQWDAIKAIRDAQGWNNPYDMNTLKAAGILGGSLLTGGPLGMFSSLNKAMPYTDAATNYLNQYMGQSSGDQWAGVSDMASPYAAQAVESPSFNTGALTSPVVQTMFGNEIAQTQPVAPQPTLISTPLPSGATFDNSSYISPTVDSSGTGSYW